MIKVKKNNELCLNVFSNISELYNYVNKTPRRSRASDSSESNDSGFAGTETLQEAYDLLLTGDEKLYKEFKEARDLKIDRLLGNVVNKKSFKNDVVGFQPNVPAYLMGVPNNMINDIPMKLSQKVINIVLCMSVSAFVSKNTLKNIGMKYAQVIDLLEKGGYRCNLYMAHAGEYNDEKNICLFKIKTDREPFNLKKCVFPIAHPAMFRRVMFRWIECCDVDNELTNGGYGRPIENKNYIKTTLEKALKANFIVWNFQNSSDVTVENIIKKLEKQGIKLGGN